MKKNKVTRLAILVLALAIASIMLVSGTYAKYASSVTGTDSVAVAKWSVLLSDTDITTAATNTLDIDLFSTILDTDGTDETDVNTGLIAPGTKGSFNVSISNESQVTAEYTLSATVINANSIPIEFSIDDGETWGSSLSGLNTASATTLAAGASSATTTVQWRWAYERGTGDTLTTNDATDTALGVLAQGTAPTVTVNLAVTATQVD